MGSKRPEEIPPLDGEGPLWLQIRRSIALAILNSDWPAGTRIPPELVLTEHYKTSRMTVNKAVQSLATEGLLQRRTKVGTVVTERARERPVMEIWDAADSIRRDGRRYGYKLLECETIRGPSPLHAAIGVGDTTRALAALEQATDAREMWPELDAIDDQMYAPVRDSPNPCTTRAAINVMPHAWISAGCV